MSEHFSSRTKPEPLCVGRCSLRRELCNVAPWRSRQSLIDEVPGHNLCCFTYTSKSTWSTSALHCPLLIPTVWYLRREKKCVKLFLTHGSRGSIPKRADGVVVAFIPCRATGGECFCNKSNKQSASVSWNSTNLKLQDTLIRHWTKNKKSMMLTIFVSLRFLMHFVSPCCLKVI